MHHRALWLAALLALAPILTLTAQANLTEPHVPRPPILIDGDAMFELPTSGVRSGSGTLEDPYVISGWHVVAGPYATLVSVRNTTRAFVIEDVTFTHPFSGTLVELVGVRDAVVRGLDLVRGTCGVCVRDSQRVLIEDVHVGSGVEPIAFRPGDGFWIQESQDVVLRSITAWAGRPFAISGSERVLVEQAELRGPAHYAGLYESHDVTILDSAFLDTHLYVYGAPSERLSVIRSTFAGPDASLEAWHPGVRDAFLCGNTFRDSQRYDALSVLGHGSTRVLGNSFVDNEDALSVHQMSGTAVVERNLVTGSTRLGLVVTLDSSAASSIVQHNALVDNAGGHLVKSPSDATLNWWGHANGPSIGSVVAGDALTTYGAVGAVAYDPWLSEAPEISVDCDAL